LDFSGKPARLALRFNGESDLEVALYDIFIRQYVKCCWEVEEEENDKPGEWANHCNVSQTEAGGMLTALMILVGLVAIALGSRKKK
jgi:hypothetical protein